jgi:c-di-GMP-related signal transduction protein
VRTHHLSQAFGIELVNIPNLEQVTTASELYHQAGILIFIDNDDIINDDATLTALLPYIDGIKLDLHRLPAQHQALIAHLQELMDAAGKDLILHGVSSHEDFQEICNLKIRYAQGYYFSRPVMPRMI